METKWRHLRDMLETNWKQIRRLNMETKVERTMEINWDYMETKSSLLRGKMKTLLNHNGDKLGDKMATPFRQNENKIEAKQETTLDKKATQS